MQKIYKDYQYVFVFMAILFPTVTFAGAGSLSLTDAGMNFSTVVYYYVIDVILVIIPVLVAVAITFFFWGLSKFMLSSGNPADIQNGKKYMIGGFVALFILFSFQALIRAVVGDIGASPVKIGSVLPE
jgi:hypothetical protein